MTIITVGDMHGSLHRTAPNAHDVILKSFMEEHYIVLPLGDQYLSEPTFSPSYRSARSTIDYAFVSEVDAQIITAMDILDLYSCDPAHRAVSLKVMFSMCNDKKLQTRGSAHGGRPAWKKTDLERYKSNVSQRLLSYYPGPADLMSPLNIELATMSLVHVLQDAEEGAVVRPRPSRCRLKPQPPDIVQALKSVILGVEKQGPPGLRVSVLRV